MVIETFQNLQAASLDRLVVAAKLYDSEGLALSGIVVLHTWMNILALIQL